MVEVGVGVELVTSGAVVVNIVRVVVVVGWIAVVVD